VNTKTVHGAEETCKAIGCKARGLSLEANAGT